MANPQERTLGEKLNTWVQTIGIIAAGIWAAYTFVYLQYLLPKSTPINVTLNLQLKKIGTGSGKRPLVPIEMKITAINPSPRTVYLLASAWVVSGYKLISPQDRKSPLKDVAQHLNSGDEEYVERHSSFGSPSVVTVGSLFGDDSLQPGETVSRTVIFYVPPGKYDKLDAEVDIPNISAEDVAKVEWTYDENSGLEYSVRETRQGKPIKQDEIESYLNNKFGFQWATSNSVLSLWD